MRGETRSAMKEEEKSRSKEFGAGVGRSLSAGWESEWSSAMNGSVHVTVRVLGGGFILELLRCKSELLRPESWLEYSFGREVSSTEWRRSGVRLTKARFCAEGGISLSPAIDC